MFDLPPEFWLAALVVCTAVTAVAVLARRHLVRRLHAVAAEAEEIATARLPAVLDALRTPSSGAVLGALPQVRMDSEDDIGTIADAFNTVLKASVEITIEHSRRHSEMLTNLLVSLGRRNQTLIDRQLDLIDELEASQDDPNTLEGLFALDHMLTTMRRNAENLLVLASDGSARRWTQPVAMHDVIRGAVSEVGEMSRVVLEMASDDGTVVVGRAAVDLSHLIAELVDNATSYSPPEMPVTVRGEIRPHGYRIWVLDHGFGMTEETLETVNATLAEGGRRDELIADQVGFQVIGRLAQRLGCQVHLQVNPGGGLAASIAVPVSNLERSESPTLAASGIFAELVPAAPRPIPVPQTITAAPPRLGNVAGLPAAFLVPGPATTTSMFPLTTTAVPEPPSTSEPEAEPQDTGRVFYRVELLDTSGVVGEPLMTVPQRPSGLVRRQPGAVFAGTETLAQQVADGSFRRLPTPEPTNPSRGVTEHEASARGTRLHDLVDGVSRGRGPVDPTREVLG